MPEADSAQGQEMEPVQPESFFTRIGGVYASPGAAFKEIGGAPRVLVPIFILIIIGLIAGFLLLQFLDTGAMANDLLRQAMQQSQQQQQLEQIRPIMSIIVALQIMIMFPIGGVINTLIVAGYGKLFSVFTGAKNTFKALLSVALYTTIAIATIKYAALVLVAFLKRPFHADLYTLNFTVASNLSGLLSGLLGEDVLPRYLMALGNFIDLFVIWMIALIAIGFSAVSRKLTTKTAAVWIGAAYGIYALISAIFLAGRI